MKLKGKKEKTGVEKIIGKREMWKERKGKQQWDRKKSEGSGTRIQGK
jgi:hypothetical protein